MHKIEEEESRHTFMYIWNEKHWRNNEKWLNTGEAWNRTEGSCMGSRNSLLVTSFLTVESSKTCVGFKNKTDQHKASNP